MGVTFEDNSENCKNAIKASAIAFLHEIGGVKIFSVEKVEQENE